MGSQPASRFPRKGPFRGCETTGSRGGRRGEARGRGFSVSFPGLSGSPSLWEIISRGFFLSFFLKRYPSLLASSFVLLFNPLESLASLFSLPGKNPATLVSEASSGEPHLVLRDLLAQGVLSQRCRGSHRRGRDKNAKRRVSARLSLAGGCHARCHAHSSAQERWRVAGSRSPREKSPCWLSLGSTTPALDALPPSQPNQKKNLRIVSWLLRCSRTPCPSGVTRQAVQVVIGVWSVICLNDKWFYLVFNMRIVTSIIMRR